MGGGRLGVAWDCCASEGADADDDPAAEEAGAAAPVLAPGVPAPEDAGGPPACLLVVVSCDAGASTGSDEGSGPRKRGDGGRAGGRGDGMLGMGNSVRAIWTSPSRTRSGMRSEEDGCSRAGLPYLLDASEKGRHQAAPERAGDIAVSANWSTRASPAGANLARRHSLVHRAVLRGPSQDAVEFHLDFLLVHV